MKILSHRGYWKEAREKNTVPAFELSFRLGYGTETDVRDAAGALVISHDPPPASGAMSLEAFVTLHQRFEGDMPLALNIKADGLAQPLKQVMGSFDIDWFVFDMSIPDMRHHLAAGNPVFGRISEHESSPPWLDRVQGIWLDAFDSDWWGADDVSRQLDAGRRVCVVSPELHGRPHEAAWERLQPLRGHDGLLLCTDIPEAASAFFGPSLSVKGTHD